MTVDVDGGLPVELERESLRLGVVDRNRARLVVLRESVRKGHVFG